MHSELHFFNRNFATGFAHTVRGSRLSDLWWDMATNPNLPLGAFITTLGGKRCTALPRTDVNTQTSTTSTSSSFSSLSTSTTSAAQVLVPVPPAVQLTTAQLTPPPPAVATSSAAVSIDQFSTIASTPEAVSPAAVAPQPQASVADNSIAALPSTAITTPLAATTASQVLPTPAQSEVLQTDSSAAAPFTTIGLASGSGAAGSATQTAGSAPSVVAVPNNSSESNGNGSTIAVAGGVIGGVAIVSLVAFFIWFWRRRVLKKRRSTLLTPLSADPSFGTRPRTEKPGYFIRRDSIGPTPRSTKIKAALRAQYGRVRGRLDTLTRSASVRSTASHSTARSVDMNRGNSQFMDPSPVIGHERKNSSALSARADNDMSIKERIMEMWARFTGGRAQDSGDDKNDIFAARGIAGGMKERAAPTPSSRRLTNKPDFLTLLNMDDSELDREAQRRRLSRTRGGSEGSGIGGLTLDFGDNPFSDVNALTTNKAKAVPLVVSGANNPFSDANAIAGPSAPPRPSTYVKDIRRSRGQSVGASTIDLNKVYDLQGLRVVNETSRPPSGLTGLGQHESSFYFRDSSGSIESFATKRGKFRSDPFDLEQLSSQVSGSIPGYTVRPNIPSSNFSTVGDSNHGGRFSSSGSISMQYQQRVGAMGAGILARPAAAHTRNISDISSRYTSGISNGTLDEWSDPGPDVGPAAQGIYDASRRSSAADAYNPYSSGSGSEAGSRRTSQASSVKLGYAL